MTTFYIIRGVILMKSPLQVKWHTEQGPGMSLHFNPKSYPFSTPSNTLPDNSIFSINIKIINLSLEPLFYFHYLSFVVTFFFFYWIFSFKLKKKCRILPPYPKHTQKLIFLLSNPLQQILHLSMKTPGWGKFSTKIHY